MPNLPKELDILEKNILRNLDEASVRSLNGCRVADQILKLVPNVPNFRTLLRGVKYWAKQRGIYANVLGFFGGISWALLSAKVCQLYPNSLPSTLLHKFFLLFSKWAWPTPVQLNEVEESREGMQLKVWNPKVFPKDAHDLMPILTPAYPSMNSTYNVTPSTMHFLKKEFERGLEILSKIEEKELGWEHLFSPLSFFSSFNAFVKVEAFASTEEELKVWKGWIESKLRFLIHFLEATPGIQFARPHPDSFQDPSLPLSLHYFFGLLLNLPPKTSSSIPSKLPPLSSSTNPTTTPQPSRKIDLNEAIYEFISLVSQTQLKKEGMNVKIVWLSRAKLPEYVWKNEEKVPPKRRKKRPLPPTSTCTQTQLSEEDPLKPTTLPSSDSTTSPHTTTSENNPTTLQMETVNKEAIQADNSDRSPKRVKIEDTCLSSISPNFCSLTQLYHFPSLFKKKQPKKQ